MDALLLFILYNYSVFIVTFYWEHPVLHTYIKNIFYDDRIGHSNEHCCFWFPSIYTTLSLL